MTSPAKHSIYINGRFLMQPRTGVQRYSREIVSALDRLLDRGDGSPACMNAEWTILAPRGTECDLNLRRVHFRVVGSGAGHLWEQRHLYRYARAGLLFSPANSGPIRHPRQIVVIHDAAIHRAPEGYAWSYRTSHRLLDRLLARRAKIATVSEFSRTELAACLHIPPREILLVPNGTDHLGKVTPYEGILDRFDLKPGKYFVTLGLSNANKNISLALEAYARLKRPDIRLLVVGARSARVAGTKTCGSGEGITFTGHLTDGEIVGLLRSAAALLFPSRYEGFGLPLLEAMTQGCPVLASTAGAVLETCGDAALHFDANDASGLTRLMERVLNEPETAAALRVRGLSRPEKYQWSASAAALCEGLDSLSFGTQKTPDLMLAGHTY